MMRPRCESCGGLLEALPMTSAELHEDAAPKVSLPALSPAFGRILRFVLFSLLIFSAARFGSAAGGIGLALAASGVVGLFTVPLIVEE
jgi:hypothetical protein